MQDRKKELAEKIDLYLKGQLDGESKQQVERWMHELDLLEGKAVDLNEQKAELKRRIDKRLLPLECEDDKIRRMPQLGRFTAAAILLLFFSFGIYVLNLDTTIPKEVKISKAKVLQSTIPSIQVIVNFSKKDSVLLLQDSTRVRLLANSRLTLKIPFESYRREVQLEGGAFFEVAHDSKRPFSVLSGNILTTALGTSFWVEQPHTGAKPRVRLITGKVSIKQRNENGEDILLAHLTPGQNWHEEPEIPVVVPVVQQPVVASSEPLRMTLFFHHKPLREVLPVLASFYKTTITFSEDELEGMSFYGSYDKENRIADILKTICVANDLQVDWNEEQNSYTIRKVN